LKEKGNKKASKNPKAAVITKVDIGEDDIFGMTAFMAFFCLNMKSTLEKNKAHVFCCLFFAANPF
jgi:hypothetical protein